MIKKINFKLLIFIFLLSTSYSMSNECELEFDIGDDVEKIFNDMGLEKGSIIEETYLDYYEQDTNYVCPDSGMNGGITQVYIKDDEVIGIKFKNSTYDEENFNEDNLIYYYVKKNFKIQEVEKISPIDINGGAEWEVAGKLYFYDKLYVKEKLKLVEELLITNKKYFYSYF
mgnify:FL=1